ncbi:pneumococcal-type histidine triad protein [Globicatella sp. PHS-GS-PNBC-21-1553]|uniref:pneumococcal-type histidine triad protein n=1 Tax=Globicatella sp. PHS-GS-PNBC-21-1553 TaxID=2885764 RepID=UPI00298F0F32|nr:pneumococcal-type histidine triad protein [Globicatella sp. PHS-GS-PNBC-21-1553]
MVFKKSLLVTLLASGVFLNQNIALAEESSSSGMNYVDGTEETRSSGMDYVDGAEENEADNNHSMSESRSQEEVNLDEGIVAEQIIVTITEEGYVTSHGDHYHYYNGEVPEDSIFLESIVTEEDLDSFEKVSEIANGWIVKKDDQYYVWLEEGKKASTVRSTDELLLQANGLDPKDAKTIVELRKDYHLTDESLIMPVVDKTSKEVLKDVDFEGQPIIVYITEKEYVLLVGIDLYVFSGDVAEEAYFSELLLVPSDYQLQDADVKQAIKDGFIVKVNDQYKLYQEKNNDHIIDIDTILQQVKKSFAEF